MYIRHCFDNRRKRQPRNVILLLTEPCYTCALRTENCAQICTLLTVLRPPYNRALITIAPSLQSCPPYNCALLTCILLTVAPSLQLHPLYLPSPYLHPLTIAPPLQLRPPYFSRLMWIGLNMLSAVRYM